MTKVIWSTDSVDTSAMLLAQALDDTIFTKNPHSDPSPQQGALSEAVDAMRDPENQVVFYGAVVLPVWFNETVFDNNRMFNDPIKARQLISRGSTAEALGNDVVRSVKYMRLSERTNYTRIRESLGATFDLVARPGMAPVATVRSSQELAESRGMARYACTHVASTRRLRVYMGIPDITSSGVIGVTISERRALSFMETLTYGASVDVRHHIERQFADGVLTEDMGIGRTSVAWTEEEHQTADRIDATLLTELQRIATRVHHVFSLDFASFDFVSESTQGPLVMTNATASPSLTNDDVLQMVASYHRNLLSNGRRVSKERLLHLIQNLSEDQVDVAVRLLRHEGVLATHA